jgi:hypothetical protein
MKLKLQGIGTESNSNIQNDVEDIFDLKEVESVE